jgi:hypothetical protein
MVGSWFGRCGRPDPTERGHQSTALSLPQLQPLLGETQAGLACPPLAMQHTAHDKLSAVSRYCHPRPALVLLLAAAPAQQDETDEFLAAIHESAASSCVVSLVLEHGMLDVPLALLLVRPGATQAPQYLRRAKQQNTLEEEMELSMSHFTHDLVGTQGRHLKSLSLRAG